MLSYVQSWFTAGANPVGVDFGTERLRLAQVEKANNDWRLVAAASAEVPAGIRHEPAARADFLARKLRELWSQGNFRGRRAVLAVPAAQMHIQHLRLPRMDDESIRRALPWEARGKLPIDPADALLRHVVAGDIYHEQEPRSEVILFAAGRQAVDDLLIAANSARLDVVGIHVEPRALLDCFSQVYRRKADADATHCFVDIGCQASRAIIARGGKMLFARNLPIGGLHFSQAVANKLKLSLDESRALRLHLATAPHEPPRDDAAPPPHDARHREDVGGGGVALLAPAAVAPSRAATDKQCVERAIREPIARLVEELSLCHRYHDAAFPDRRVERLIFVGGEACQRELCQQVARQLGIAAQLGDPLVRMVRSTEVGIESGIDRRQPQPAWAVAVGLSMGSSGSSAT